MAAARQVKVLLSGEVAGQLSALFKKVSIVNTKNGPFDVLFCVGAFFSPDQPKDEVYEEMLQYLKGEKLAPLPTYFIGGYGWGSEVLSELEPSPECNVHYLGKKGARVVEGLSVVFLDGRDGSSQRGGGGSVPGYFSPADVQHLQRQVDTLEGDVDILLTCDWPQGVTNGVPASLLPASLQSAEPAATSSAVADVALFVRPRYHFVGGMDLHFTRLPYLNKDLGAGVRATRFIALASVTNTSKQKNLHALALNPATSMTPEQLSQKPEGCTPSPYGRKPTAGMKRGLDEEADEAAGANSAEWRWQTQRKKRETAAPSLGRPGVVKDSKRTVFVKNLPFAATEEHVEEFFAVCGEVEDFRRTLNQEGKLNTWALVQFKTEEAVERACQMNGMELMGRPLYIDVSTQKTNKEEYGKPAAGCWFCLSSSAADVNLVVSVAEEAYLSMDKGPINENHALIIPVEHYPSIASLPPAALIEVERYLSAVRSCFAAMGKEMVAFERYLTFRSQAAGNHCHINVCAIPSSAAKDAKQEFMRAAEAAGYKPTELPKFSGESGREHLKEVVGDGEYFQFILPDGSRLVQTIERGDRWALHVGREVVAKLAGVPQKADWKTATCSDEEIQRLVEEFKQRFQEYDIMQ